MARKWVYWHRVTESFDEKYPVGSLLGLGTKETEAAGFIEVGEDKNFHIDLKHFAKLKFVGKMLATATAEEVNATFKEIH